MQSSSSIATALCWLLNHFVTFERRNWSLVKTKEIKGYFGNSRGGSFHWRQGRRKKKTVLSGSEIDGGESLSFWHSPSDRFRVALAAAVIVICVWLLWHTLHERQGVNEGRRKGNKIWKCRSRFKCPSDMPWNPIAHMAAIIASTNRPQQDLCRVRKPAVITHLSSHQHMNMLEWTNAQHQISWRDECKQLQDQIRTNLYGTIFKWWLEKILYSFFVPVGSLMYNLFVIKPLSFPRNSVALLVCWNRSKQCFCWGLFSAVN